MNSAELTAAEYTFNATPNEKLPKVFNKALLVALCTSRLQQSTQVLEAKTKRELAELLISWVSRNAYMSVHVQSVMYAYSVSVRD